MFDENLMKEAEKDEDSKDKGTILKRMGLEGEEYEIDSEGVVKENELVLSNGRRMLIRERKQ
jgi:hypothetical protein